MRHLLNNLKEVTRFFPKQLPLRQPQSLQTATQPQGRFGSLSLQNGEIKSCKEKPAEWINAGFFVLSRNVINRIDGDECSWEEKPMESLASEGEFSVYFHNGFWQPMDTLRDKNKLEELWNKGDAPWKTWS